MKGKTLCPVCEKYYFNEMGDYDICSNCGWENDNVQYDDHDYWGGANDLSVNEAKVAYEISLCEGQKNKLNILQKEHNDSITAIYSKYGDIDYRTIDGDSIRSEFKKEHDRYVKELERLNN